MNDRNSERAYPTWIPEGLLRATAELSKGKLQSSAEEKAESVRSASARILHSDTADGTDSGTIPDRRQEKIRESIRVSPQVSSEGFLNRLGFLTDESRRREFFGKAVIDIGGGFSGLAPLLSKFGANVIVADPVFFEDDIETHYRTDLGRIFRFMRELEEKIDNGAESKLLDAMERNLADIREVYAEMLFWNGYSPEAFPHIRRLAAYAENLRGIEDASQDVAFLCNVVGKPTLDVEWLYRELDRVLVPDGQIFALDYDDAANRINSEKLERLLGQNRAVVGFTDEWYRIIVS